MGDKGSVAKLVVKIELKDLGRRATGTSKATEPLACGPSQSAVATTIALGGKYGGVTYPNIFGKGKGEEVVAPTDAPVMRPVDAKYSCVDVQNLDLVSFAPGLDCKLHLAALLFVALAVFEL